MTIRFSVFVPVWNGAKWLPAMIKSVLAQTYRDWELIIGDNASDQDLAAAVRESAGVDPRIRYHRWATYTDIHENFNRTLGLCRFEWLQPLSADDRLHPTCLERMAMRIAEGAGRPDRTAMVLTDARRVDANGRPADALYYGYQGAGRVPDGWHDAAAWAFHATAPGVVPWQIGSVAFSREVLAEMGSFLRPDVGLCADIELMLRTAAYGEVAYIAEPLMDYTVRDDSDASGRSRRNRERADHQLAAGAIAYLMALATHEERRAVSPSERVAWLAAAARAHLLRASQHRYLSGGRGRRGAFRDIVRALSFSPRTVLAPWPLARAFGTVLLPRWTIARGRRLLLKRRFGTLSDPLDPNQ